MMTNKRALELLKIERECIRRADTCDRKCADCELVQDSEELLDKYEYLIILLDRIIASGV